MVIAMDTLVLADTGEKHVKCTAVSFLLVDHDAELSLG
jgi:hypothetical protein